MQRHFENRPPITGHSRSGAAKSVRATARWPEDSSPRFSAFPSGVGGHGWPPERPLGDLAVGTPVKHVAARRWLRVDECLRCGVSEGDRVTPSMYFNSTNEQT